MAAAVENSSEYDRIKELKEFDETKAGVKGLADSGIKKIPRIFIDDHENLPKPSDLHDTNLKVPIIDLRGIDDSSCRQKIVADIGEASKSWGFFQLLNHGIPVELLDGMLQCNRRLHELDSEVKAMFYSRDHMKKKVMYISNFDLYKSLAANWRDTFYFIFDGSLDLEELPTDCREMLNYKQQIMVLVEMLCELLSEALGMDPCYLKSINCTESQNLTCLYYPPCPEPNLTLGTTQHADPSIITLLLQDNLGGLQVLHQNQWVPLAPIRGALVVNIGDFLQLISNDKFKSVEHRVVASYQGPRLSVAMFFKPVTDGKRSYGPIKEVLSDENPPKYKEILVRDYMTHYANKGLGRESALNHFKL